MKARQQEDLVKWQKVTATATLTALICGFCVMQVPHRQLFIDLHLHLQSCAVKCCLQAEKQGPCTRCVIQSYRCMFQQHHTQQALPREGRCICLIPIRHAHTFTYTVSFASPSLTSVLLGVGGLPCIQQQRPVRPCTTLGKDTSHSLCIGVVQQLKP